MDFKRVNKRAKKKIHKKVQQKKKRNRNTPKHNRTKGRGTLSAPPPLLQTNRLLCTMLD